MTDHISPRRRQTIIRAAHSKDGFRGHINHYRAEIVAGNPTRWRVCINREWTEGGALNAWDAIDCVGEIIRRAQWLETGRKAED